MSEQDLRERMELSVAAYLNDAVIDPGADLARGRRRLVRRRAAIGLAGIAAAVVVAIGAGSFAMPSAVNAPASTPTPMPVVAQPPDSERDRVGAQVLSAALKYLDAKHLRTTGEPQGIGHTGFDKKKRSVIGSLGVDDNWTGGKGTGQVWINVAQPDHAQPASTICGPKRSQGFMPYRCSAGVAPDGRPIVTGEATMDVKASDGIVHRAVRGYFVRYIRQDGQVVDVGVDGVNLTFTERGLPQPPVTNPQVTMQQLIAAATDPAMTLKK